LPLDIGSMMEIISTINTLETNRPQVLYRPMLWSIMNGYKSLTGCNAYRFAPEEERPEHCDCHNCVSYALDIMETIQMEIALEVKHG